MSELDAALGPLPAVNAVLSDIDGTIVHYDKLMPSQGYERLREVLGGADDPEYGTRDAVYFMHKPTGVEVKCWKVPSLTLGGGYISARTLTLIDQLRETHGVRFILMTGARTSTLLLRRRSHTLPKTEYDVAEGGGKMWHHEAGDNSADVPVEQAWSQRFEPLCGPSGQLEDEPATRVGRLWDIYRALAADGYALDAKSFSTSFLVNLEKSKACLGVEQGGLGQSWEAAEQAVKQRFQSGEFGAGFWYVTNLGKGQVCAEGSGKHAAADYILSALRIDPKTCVALFDDENDLEFADQCGAGFIPSVAHASVLPAVEKKNTPAHRAWMRTPVDGPLGTDAALEAVLRKVQSAAANSGAKPSA